MSQNENIKISVIEKKDLPYLFKAFEIKNIQYIVKLAKTDENLSVDVCYWGENKTCNDREYITCLSNDTIKIRIKYHRSCLMLARGLYKDKFVIYNLEKGKKYYMTVGFIVSNISFIRDPVEINWPLTDDVIDTTFIKIRGGG
jgi:hypothetical protein